ncbi:MAG: undecaprenyl/decaprenyl-phosphate alpha-N-acetylglucosaminyl 1-phosphate transferase [Bacteroidaceae bacterium]|nr:undecaprenyl/decaprenyl-phosphate alpha-N-acetylglucosaminyl 1-phosphate transferase [Bacteroidaceae bacterium]MBR1799990.1 undecaprenyl/decaprenyl-phosphate alpha-N-acetylglucosaminyl 1-phosphate transferase [Bacteroidaceae bacterium]
MAELRIYILLALVIGAAVTAIVIPLIIAFCRKFGYFDQPNQRKVHHVAVPRLGGLAFLPAMAMGSVISLLAYFSNTLSPPDFHFTAALMIVGATIVYLLGLVDDLLDLPANLKFVILAIGSAILPVCNLQIDNLYGLFGIGELPLWVAYPLTVLIIMTIVNAINLIDGIDGLASGIAAICLVVFTYLFWDLRTATFMSLSAALLGSVLAFFCFNVFGKFGGHKIFMGDAGSLILGYVLSYLAIKYMMMTEQDIYTDVNPLLLPYSVFIVPVYDLVRVAVTRVLDGQPMFQADNRHIHHVLMRCGLTMHQTLAVILLLVVLFIAGNLWLDAVEVPFTVIFFIDAALYLLFFVVAYSIVHRRESFLELLSEE